MYDLCRGEDFQVTIVYETTPTCSAVQWLEPAQTAGKTHPYLYTQCQVSAVMQACLLYFYYKCILVPISQLKIGKKRLVHCVNDSGFDPHGQPFFSLNSVFKTCEREKIKNIKSDEYNSDMLSVVDVSAILS